MFWHVVIAAALATGLVQLGALSVWVVVLQTLLGVVLAIALCIVLLFVWHRYRS